MNLPDAFYGSSAGELAADVIRLTDALAAAEANLTYCAIHRTVTVPFRNLVACCWAARAEQAERKLRSWQVTLDAVSASREEAERQASEARSAWEDGIKARVLVERERDRKDAFLVECAEEREAIRRKLIEAEATIARLTQERDRLRAALEQIGSLVPNKGSASHRIDKIVRAALTPTTPADAERADG